LTGNGTFDVKGPLKGTPYQILTLFGSDCFIENPSAPAPFNAPFNEPNQTNLPQMNQTNPQNDIVTLLGYTENPRTMITPLYSVRN